MKFKKIFTTIIIILVLSVVIWQTLNYVQQNNTDDKSDWQTAVVTRRTISSSVLATGIIKPKVGAEVRVGSRVSGIVKHLHVKIGDFVKKGNLLAELNPTELQAKYDQNKAALDNAKANYEYSKVDLKRQQSLLKQNFISQNQVDLAEKTYEISQAQVKQAEANLAFAKIQLDYTKIRATITGVIASVSTQEGETVAASFSSPTFVTILDLDRQEVWAYIDETDIGRIKEGQRASFSVDTYSDVDFEGKVTAIYPKAIIQDNVVNYISTIEIMNTRQRILRPEMTTTVTIFLESRENVLTVPNKAVKRELGRKFVYIMQDNQPVRKWIKTGWKDGSYTEVRDGLIEGEKVIIN